MEEGRKSVLFEHGWLAFFLGAYLVLLALTSSDYGPNWDAALGELYLGDRYFYFLTTLDRSYLDLSLDNIPLYHRPDHPDFHALSRNVAVFGDVREFVQGVWGFGQVLTAATKHVFYTRLGLLDPIDAHQLAPGLAVAVQCAVLYYFARRYLGSIAAVTALLSLVTFPRYWADLHHDAKDVIEAVFYTLVLCTTYQAVRARSARLVLGAAVLWGMALATKANALFLPLIIGPWLLLDLFEHRRRGAPWLPRPALAALCASPLVAFAVFLVCWPYLLLDFPANLREHVGYLRYRAGVGPDHWQSEALINAVVTMPIAVMVLAAAGLVAMARAWRDERRRGLHLLVLLWLCVPVLRVSVPRAVDFDVLRHWLEFVPALALVAGIGAEALCSAAVAALGRAALVRDRGRAWAAFLLRHRVPAASAALVLWFSPVIGWDVANHPFQVAFYNELVGGLSGARARGLPGATDYWGSSYRAGLRWLNEHAEPGASVIVPVASHIAESAAPVRKRADLALGGARPPVYVMYFTRKPKYRRLVLELEERGRPAHEILVQGAPILRIYRLADDPFGQEMLAIWKRQQSSRGSAKRFLAWVKSQPDADELMRSVRSSAPRKAYEVLLPRVPEDLRPVLEDIMWNMAEESP